MRVELLFLRWFLAIAVVALCVMYARSTGVNNAPAQYERIPLVHGGQSSGMPLAGIMVDPARRDIYAIVGGPGKDAAPAKFFIVWNGEQGHAYATTFPQGEARPDALFAISPSREIEPVHSFVTAQEANDAQWAKRIADSEKVLRSVVDAVPPFAGTAHR